MITDRAVDSSFKPRFEQVVLDDVVVRSTELDQALVEELLACSKEIPDVPTLVGHTMCTYDFYEGKGSSGCPPSPSTAAHATKARSGLQRQRHPTARGLPGGQRREHTPSQHRHQLPHRAGADLLC